MEVFNDVQKQSFHIFYQIGVLKKFLKLTGKHLWCHLFDNVVTLQAATLLNKRLRHKCFFRLKFWIIWKNTSYQKVSGWLALNLVHVMKSPNFMNTCPSVIYKKKKNCPWNILTKLASEELCRSIFLIKLHTYSLQRN